MKTKLTPVQYLGYTAMDRRFSTAMLPWLLLEIRRLGGRAKLSIAVEGAKLKAYNINFEKVLVHALKNVIRKSQVPGSPEEFFYILWSERDKLLQCYLFRAATVHDVTELFAQMKDPSPGGATSAHGSTSSLVNVTKNQGFHKDGGSTDHISWSTPECHLSAVPENKSQLLRTNSNASVLTSLSADLTPSDSHFFEVLYIGKVKVSQRKVPDSLIDDALLKFDQHEAEKMRQATMRRHSLLSSQATSLSSNPGSNEDLIEIPKPTLVISRESDVNLPHRNLNLSSTSTTPLEPDKEFAWKSAEHLQIDSPEIDDEFDSFTKERVEKSNEKHIKRPTPVALEPKVLILNYSPPKTSPTNKINLCTLEEDESETVKNEDIYSIISDTASSITQFCQESYRKDLTPNRDDSKDHNGNAVVNTAKDKIKLAEIRIESQDAQGIDEIPKRPRVLTRSKTGLEHLEKRSGLPENKPFLRDRSASIGTLNLHKTPIAHLIGEQNRTMLFQVGRNELRLISPDRKQILLLKAFRDVASCVLGRVNRDHFGFVCRETNTEGYVCYVFKCESDSVASDVINAIKQAFNSHALGSESRERSPNMTCEHCPMLWYHRLCHDSEGMNDKKTHAFILRRMEQLPEEEQDQIIAKYQGGTNHKYEVSEHNAFLMMLLRAHCEAKQQRHVHDTAENRSEFLNQYLGGSTIFMKAKRSLSSGFDHLLKRKISKDDLHQPGHLKKEASPLASEPVPESATSSHLLAIDPGRSSKSVTPPIIYTSDSQDVPEPTTPIQDKPEEEPLTPIYGSPIMDIFLKTGDTKTSEETRGDATEHGNASTWRQAIFQRVVSPAVPDNSHEEDLTPGIFLTLPTPGEPAPQPGRRSKEQLRELWKMAIDQTILLVRMERENAKLKEREESSAVRRIKLEYCELGSSITDGAGAVWDTLLSRDSARRVEKVDRHMLTQCVRQGVPRMLRGSIWYFLAEQACLRSAPPDSKNFPMYNVPYYTLLSGLTKHQHAILIDLGRTFPQHSYFASALGPGQLALYNLLKAYSLVDPEVGYCQGLSFVAGVLLLHMEEAEAFVLLRHLMFRRGLRKQYLPDMSALQIQLYQMSRLLRDHEPELHSKLEQLDIAPALYAAPWMLTLFTSQFPLGFVVRVFDMLFLNSTEVIFSVALALLSAHKDGLMLCESCEEAAEYLKHKLPNIGNAIYEKVMKKVFTLDIGRQLAEYAVEYGVLREEMPRVAQLGSLQHACKELESDKQRALAELDSAMERISAYQSSQSRLESQNRAQEQQIMILSRYIMSHHDKKHELPPDVKRICQLNKKTGFGNKIVNFSSKFSSNESSEEEDRRTVKSGMSTPNLFSRMSKDEVNALRDIAKVSPENDRKPMKKSLSVNSGLIAPTLKLPLKMLDEKPEDKVARSDYTSDSLNDDFMKDTMKEIGRKNSGFFANTHESIRQERLFAQQQKDDFDENLRRLDQKLSPNRSSLENLTTFQSQKSLSLNLDRKTDKSHDSGLGTPSTPLKFDDKNDASSVISHPLSDCDVDITFDCHNTELKSIRKPSKNIIEIQSPEKTKNAT